LQETFEKEAEELKSRHQQVESLMLDLKRSNKEASKRLQEVEKQRKEVHAREREIQKKMEEAAVDLNKKLRDLSKQKKKLTAEEQKIRKMQRNLHDHCSIPSSWSSTEPPSKGVRMVPIKESSELFCSLGRFLMSSRIGQGGNDQKVPEKYSKLSLKCAWRIENPDLWRSYCSAKKKVMGLKARGISFPSLPYALYEASCKVGVLDDEVNEARLVHGTSPAILESLLQNGLNERFSGTW
jgi:hypothetical protein